MGQLSFEDVFGDVFGGGVKGRRFCFTGGLASMNRRSASNKVRALGGTVSNHVCKTTDYLVVAGGSLTGGSAKLKDAERLGVRTITEKEFLAMM